MNRETNGGTFFDIPFFEYSIIWVEIS